MEDTLDFLLDTVDFIDDLVVLLKKPIIKIYNWLKVRLSNG